MCVTLLTVIAQVNCANKKKTKVIEVLHKVTKASKEQLDLKLGRISVNKNVSCTGKINGLFPKFI